MARNTDLLERMYRGEPTRPAPRRRPPGVIPALWLLAFLGMGATALAVSLGTGGAITLGYADNDLVRLGVLFRDETVLAYAEPHGATDGRSGCVLVSSGHLVQWADPTPTGRVDLRAGALTVDDERAVARSADGQRLECHVGPEGDTFRQRAEPFLAHPHPHEHPARDVRVDRYRRSFQSP